MSTPLCISDLDGTLANLLHRRHFVERSILGCPNCGYAHNEPRCRLCDAKHPQKANWDAFHKACVHDTPILPVIHTIWRLLAAGADVWVWSGRMETVRAETEWWLGVQRLGHLPLKMRPAGDYTPDDQLKQSWLDAMPKEDRARLVLVFDDRQRVVNMWRDNGVVCAQVAPGDF
jgi:hypothetical protein